MQFKVILLGLASAGIAAAQSLTINTPTSLITCVPTLIQWTGGSGPYYLYANQGGSTSQILETLVNNQNVNSYTWVVDLPAGTSVTLAIRDSTGAQNFAQQVTIQQGSTTSCSSSSSSGAAGASTSSGSSSSTPSSSSSSMSSSSSTTRSSSTMTSASSSTSAAATTSARPTTSSVPNAAPTQAINAGAALAVAAVAAAFL